MPIREYATSYRITDLELSERPRERLAAEGPNALNSAELLGILLRVGIPGENAVQMGDRLLREMGGLSGIQRLSFDELCSQRGLGPAKAAQIKAAIELGRRLTSTSPEDRPTIHSPADAAALVQYEMGALEQEELWVMLLDTRNHVVHTERLYKGSLNTSMVRVGEVFKAAIRRNCNSIIICHNHPSGDPSPSAEDVALTRSLISAGRLLDIEVLDHLVIGAGRFVSLKERGSGFA
ncbi:MAG: DNA repair protein RadC [Anaerolineaceae bacterium]